MKSFYNKNILIATGIFPPDIGGPATYAQALCEELPKLGCEIKIVTYADCINPKSQIPNPKQIQNSPAARRAAGQAKFKIIKVNREKNIIIRYFLYFWRVWKMAKWADVIYILDLMSAGAPAVLAAKLRNKKVVFRTGGDFLWEKAYQSGWTDLPLRLYYENKKNSREKFLLKLCGWLIKKIDIIIFSTKLQADIYAEYYNVPEDKIKFVQNPVPELQAGERDEKYKDSIVFAGRLVKLKNLKKLIKVFGELRDKNTKLLICGDGPEKNDLQKLIDNLKLNERVKLAGNIEHKELVKIINGCKFLILPSITEISPNLALECLSLKKPILLTAETGLPAEITKNLITFNPLSEEDLKNKIEFLLNSENLKRYEERLEQSPIAKRSWEEAAREHCEIFYDII
jgi:glycosyltransferase involved in cell wall biosynthesis